MLIYHKHKKDWEKKVARKKHPYANKKKAAPQPANEAS